MDQHHFVAGGEVLVETDGRLCRKGHGQRTVSLFQVRCVLTAEGLRHLAQTGLGFETQTAAFRRKRPQIDLVIGLGRGRRPIFQIELKTLFAVDHQLIGSACTGEGVRSGRGGRVEGSTHSEVDEHAGFDSPTGRDVVDSAGGRASFAGGNAGTVRG